MASDTLHAAPSVDAPHAFERRRVRALLELPALAELLPERELLQRGGALVEELTASAASSLRFVDAARGRIEILAWSGHALDRSAAPPLRAEQPLGDASVWAEAVRTRAPVVRNDASATAREVLGVELADVQRFVIVPTLEAGEVVMLSGVANKPTPYGEGDVETIELIANALWRLVQRRRSVTALRESEDRLRLALASANQGIFDVDLATGEVVVTPEYATLLGFDPADFRETTTAWLARLHPDDRPHVEGVYRDYLAGRRSEIRLEFRQRTKSGAWKWLLAVGQVTERDAQGRPLRLLGTHADVDVRRREQEEHRRIITSLAQADRLASMGMLAAGVAHEINNPLTYVMLTLEDLRDELPKSHRAAQRCVRALSQAIGAEALTKVLGEDLERTGPPAQAELIERLRRAGDALKRVKKIVRGLGTFARVEDSDVGAVSLEHSIEHALAMAHNEIKYRARVVRELGETPPVVGSEGKLAQVFLNLFINAAHAIREGHVDANTITIRTWASGDSVFAEVADTGHGIPEDLQPRIFEPFVTTKPIGVGSGLGLSICRRILDELGAKISFTSAPGRGTQFRIELVAAAVDELPATDARPPKAHERGPVPTGRVLIVDDEPGIRLAMVRLLQDAQAVLTAASGDEAQELLTTDHHIDVIFCDLIMPRTSGMELHRWLTTWAPGLAERVVFMTGGAFTPEAARYVAHAGNPTIEKPFERATILALTEERIRAARSSAT